MSRVWVGIKRAWKIIWFALGCIVLTVCIFLIWRVSSTGTPDELMVLSKNDDLVKLYTQKGEDTFMFKQKQDIITRTDYNSGYFSIPEYVFIPDANQLQLVFRYNNSTLEYVARDKKLPAALDRNADHFDVSLVFYMDLTPENLEDNEYIDSENVKAIRCKGHVTGKDQTTLYNFYRYTFFFEESEEPIDINALMKGNSLIAIHAQFNYVGDMNVDGVEYPEKPYGALLLYDPAMENIRVELTSDDIDSLTAKS